MKVLLLILTIIRLFYQKILSPKKQRAEKNPLLKIPDKRTLIVDLINAEKNANNGHNSSINIKDVFSTLDKPLPKYNLKPLSKLNKAKSILKKLSKKQARMGMLGAAVDLIQVPSYKPVSLVQALQLPQISDSRIKILTVNPPPKPILPGMLPNPHFKLNMEIPENKPAPNITKDVNIVTTDELNGIVSSVVKSSFLKALSKVNGKKYGSKKQGIYRLNIFGSDTERILYNEKIKRKTDLIDNKLTRIVNSYENFQRELDKKMDFLNFALKEYYGISLNFLLKS